MKPSSSNMNRTKAYLVWALTRLGTHRDVFGLTAAEATPAAYKRELDGN